MSIVKKITCTAMLAVALSGFISTQASALNICRWFCRPVIQYSAALGGATETINVNGTANFNVASSTDQPWSQTLSPASFNGNGQSQFNGAFTMTLDQTRTSDNSTVNANQTASRFPASGHIHLYSQVKFSAFPNLTFRSIAQHDLQTSNLNSWDPQVQEQWVQLTRVDFEEVNHPGVIAFSILSLTAVIS